ncbi:MAG TPA: TIGR03790 family protein [Verrucomicrobiae bacterium]|nr:TIGR03790 family protein [Verrucomicrobiae bacterium]
MLKRVFAALILFFQAVAALAGGSGLNTVVVVNQNSPQSVQLGNDYCELRGVPPQNFLRLTNWTGGNVTWLESDFELILRDPLLSMLTAAGLTNQVQYVLLSMDIPYRVALGDAGNSTTSDLFYGFKPNGPAPGPGLPDTCSLPDLSSNSFAFSELPFEQSKPNTAVTNSFLAFFLTDSNLAGAETVLSRGVAADSSFPNQTAVLQKTSDWARNVRFFSFDNAVFDSRVRGDSSIARIASDSMSFTNTRGLMTGFTTFSLPTNSFVPGALGDNLTSYGGDIFENSGQTPLLEFLHAGAVASYGTIVEPCNYLQKFPDPMEFFYQSRGFSAGEAYYMSLLNPFQGVLVGEPLAAPFAQRGQASWQGLTDGTLVQGQVSLPSATFSAAAPQLPIQQVDLFIDGTWAGTLTNVSPNPGNIVTIQINGSGIPYVVPPGATVASIASGLADAVNLQSNTLKVAASAVGDRIEFQGLDIATPGSNILLSVTASGGVSALTTGATPSSPSFLDTIATGYATLTASNNTVLGDWLHLRIQETNGAVFDLGVTNNSGDTNISTLCQSLEDAVGLDTSLYDAKGVLPGEIYPDLFQAQFLLYARAPGWAASQIQVTLTASPDLVVSPSNSVFLQDNVSDLRPRDHLYVYAGLPQVSVSPNLDTTHLADGFHDLTLVAYEGTSVKTQTRITRTVQIQNSSLFATLKPRLSGAQVPLNGSLVIDVNAGTNAVSSIELFSTGGCLGVVSNQPSASFQVSTDFLGQGLHPFYAMVTDTSGHRFKTQTTSIRIVAPLALAISTQPLALSWPSIPGATYDVLGSTHVDSGFQKVASIAATNSVTSWPIVQNAAQMFYRLQTQ